MTRFVPPVAVALALLCTTPTEAQETLPPHDALRAPLHPLTSRDLARLEPLMALGVAGIVEHDMPPLLPAIHYAVRIDAPAETVAEIVATPEGFPELLPAVNEVRIEERRGNSVAYHWQWQTSVFSLGGRAMLTNYAPPAAQRERGWRVVVERTEGDLGHGREVWRIRPTDDGGTVLALSTRMDLADANYVTRQMPSSGRSLSRSITMTTALAMMLRVQAEAERRAGRPPRVLDPELRRPAIDVRPLEPMLLHADIVLIEAAGEQFRQSAVITRYPRREAQVRSVMGDPVAFSEALIQGSTATVTGQPAPRTVAFDWRYDMPLVGASGSMVMREREDRVLELDATEGSMRGGRWRFETSRLPSGATAVLGWAHFDVAEGNFVLRAICDADPTFHVGLGASTEIMMARAVRIRIDRIPEAEDHVPTWRVPEAPATPETATASTPPTRGRPPVLLRSAILRRTTPLRARLRRSRGRTR
ncbi:MAG: SRPBCC family protein [Myxococcales bacterium]|nr:SRPBCC family protein [Myxococcales bacterium]